MNKMTILKNQIEKYNPIALYRRKRMQRRLTNREVTLFTPDCLGGILLHDLSLRFLSPTVNLMMMQPDFLTFLMDYETYLSKGTLKFFHHKEFACPCAILNAGDDVPEVPLHFTHYGSEEDASEKWFSRAKRIRRDNIFVVIEERDGITKEDLLKLKELKVKGVCAFTCNEYPDIPYAVYLPEFHKNGEVGNILTRNYLTDARKYEDYFDFVGWFNEADGGDYDVSKFIRMTL